MTGLLGVPQSFVDDINERAQDALPDARKDDLPELVQANRLEEKADFGYFGVSDPVLCLPLGSTVAWHVRPSPNPIYPVYLRSNLLNTNQHFDYGAFSILFTEEIAELVVQREPAMVMKEDPAVVRARRALVRRLKAQDPRLFIAVLNKSKEIQQEVEEQCDLIGKERTEGLMNLLEKTRHLNEEFTSNLRDITISEAWLKKHDEEREEALNSLLSLLCLKRKDLVNKLARAANEEAELMKNSALLELDAARAKLDECEDEAEESRAVATYRIVGLCDGGRSQPS
ncbi:hypothetical protein Emag_000009 [Eimeria magna]